MSFSSHSSPLVEISTNWSTLFTEICKLLNAVQVVCVRTTRMAMAGPVPDKRDRLEFSLMSLEKSEVAAESTQAMGTGFINRTIAFARDISKYIWATSAATMTLASSRSAAQWFERQASLIKLATHSPANPLQLASSATCLSREILAPIHSRVTANARRLSPR